MDDEKITDINEIFKYINEKEKYDIKEDDRIGFPLKKYNKNKVGASEKRIMERFENLKKYTNLPKSIFIEEDTYLKAPFLYTKDSVPKKNREGKIHIPKEYLKFQKSNGKKEHLAIEFTNMNDENYNPILVSEHYSNDLISDYFHEIQRLKCFVKNKISNWEYFKENKEKLKDEFKNEFEKKGIVDRNELLFQYREKIWNDSKRNAPECSQFRPTVMVSMINYLFQEKEKKDIHVLDFSSGWGDRLIAALTFADENLKYIGYDPNSSLIPGYQKIKNFFLKGELEQYKKNFLLINEPFELRTSKSDLNIIENKYDLVLTSPPYFKYEKYCDEETQCIFGKDNEDEWLKSFMFPSLQKIKNLLNNKGKLVLIINNYGKKNRDSTNYVEKIIYFIHKNLPIMKHKGMISYYEKKYSGEPIPQPMWIWEKSIDSKVLSPLLNKIIPKEILDENYNLNKLDNLDKYKNINENTLKFISKQILKNQINENIKIIQNDKKYKLDEKYKDLYDKLDKLKNDILDYQDYVFENINKKCSNIWNNYDIYNNKERDNLKEKYNMKFRPTFAWLKIYEIINNYKLLENLNTEGKIVHFDNCAMPGSFILSINHYIKTKMKDKEYEWYGSSILNEGEEDFLKDEFGLKEKNPEKWVMKGNNNGNVISKKNQENWRDIFQENKVDIYTSDGGFAVGKSGYKNKELDHSSLNLGQILTGILTLKKGGCMVTKQYTFFEPLNISILAILTNLFENIYISKPITSKITNTETYIVAKKFLGYGYANQNGYIDLLLDKIKKLEDNEDDNKIPLIKITSLNRDFIENIYNISYDIYKRHIYHLMEKYKLCEKNKDRNSYNMYIQAWKDNILQNWNKINNIEIIDDDDNLNAMDKKREGDIRHLQLGDIVSIEENDESGKITGIIIFINKTKMIIKNKKNKEVESTWETKIFNINNRIIIDIKSITLLNRKNTHKFILQNNLKINTRIKIIFNDDTKNECYGIIVKKQNDGIIVDLYPNPDNLDDKKTIYIDFKYEGLPEGIENIIFYKYSFDIKKKIELDSLDIYKEKVWKNDENKFYLLDDKLDKLYEKIIQDYGNYSFKNIKNAKLQVKRYNELLREYPKLSKINNIGHIPLVKFMGGYGSNYSNYKTKVKWIIPTVMILKKAGSEIEINDDIYDINIDYETDYDFYENIEDEENNMRLPNNTLYKNIDEKYKNFEKHSNYIDNYNFEITIGDNIECFINNDMDDTNFVSTNIANKTSENGTFKSGKGDLYSFGKSLFVKHKCVKNLDLFSSEIRDNIEKLYVNGFITTDYNLYEYSKIYSKNLSIYEKSIYSKCNLNRFSIDIHSSSENPHNNPFCNGKNPNIKEKKLDEEKDENYFKTYSFYKIKDSEYEENKDSFISSLIPNTEESINLEMDLNKIRDINKNINEVSILRLIKKLSSFSINEYNITNNCLRKLIIILNQNIDTFKEKLLICDGFLNKNEKLNDNEKEINNSIEKLVIENEIYNMVNNIDFKKLTNSEILQFILNSDEGNLYRLALKIIVHCPEVI